MMTNNIDFFPQRPDSHPKIYGPMSRFSTT